MSGKRCTCSGDGIVGVMIVRMKQPNRVRPVEAALVADVMEASCALVEDGLDTLEAGYRLERPYDKLLRNP